MKRKILIGWSILTLIPAAGLLFIIIPDTVRYGINTINPYYSLMQIVLVVFSLCWPTSILAFLFWRKKQNKYIWRLFGSISFFGFLSLLFFPFSNYLYQMDLLQSTTYTYPLDVLLPYVTLSIFIPIVLLIPFFAPVFYSLFRLSFPQKSVVNAKTKSKKKKK